MVTEAYCISTFKKFLDWTSWSWRITDDRGMNLHPIHSVSSHLYFHPIILFRAKLFLLFSPLFVCCLNNFLFYFVDNIANTSVERNLFYRYSIELFKVLCWYMNILSPYPFPIQFAYLNFFGRKFYSHVVSQDKFSLESWCILKCRNKKTQFLQIMVI